MKPEEVKEDILTILEEFGIDEAMEGADYNNLVDALFNIVIKNINKLNKN